MRWGIPRERIVHEPHGFVPAQPLPERERRRGARDRFGFFGQFTEFKGADVLLEAFASLAKAGEDFHGRLWIHGANLDTAPAEFQDRFRELLEDAGDRVRLVGQYDRADLAKLMARVDWVVIPSIWWETGPLTVGEAFQHGRPVICSDMGGMSEKVTDGVNGLYFRRGDADELADVIERAATTPGLWEELRRGIPAVPTMREHVAVAQLALPAAAGVTGPGPRRARPTARAAVRVSPTRSDERGTRRHTRRHARHAAGGRRAAGRMPFRRRARGRPAGGPLRGRPRAGPADGPGGESRAATVSAKTFSRRLLAPLPAGERNRLSDTLARAGDGAALSRSLHELREALRERLPRYARAAAGPRGLVVDSVLALDERSFYLEGWAIDREAEIVRLEAVSPEGERVDLAAHAFRFPLPHVSAHFGDADAAEEARPGFLCFVELEGPSHLDERVGRSRWRTPTANAWRPPRPTVLRDRSAARERVLADPARERVPDDELMESHVRPAIERLQRAGRRPASGIRIVEQFGDRAAGAGRLDRDPALQAHRPRRGAAGAVRARPVPVAPGHRLRARLARGRGPAARAGVAPAPAVRGALPRRRPEAQRRLREREQRRRRDRAGAACCCC